MITGIVGGAATTMVGAADGRLHYYENIGTPASASWANPDHNYGGLDVGDYNGNEIDKVVGEPLIEQILAWHWNDPSRRIHSATEWLLRRWDRGDVRNKLQREIPL